MPAARMSTLFISDLHLTPAREDITAQFLDFLEHEAAGAEALYILGDLFEAWLGDDAGDELVARIEQALARTAAAGVRCYFMHGNRDFLVGRAFARRTGVEILPEGSVVDLYGTRVLLLHGDSLCTDDRAYQRFRRFARNPLARRVFLMLPPSQRRRIAREARERSAAAIAQKAASIMDVNQAAVEQALRAHGVRAMLHGHTHRPDVHRFAFEGGEATRIVLGDWFEQGSRVRWDPTGFELLALPR
jgi:UDP-2,3-diacylglucosamine hydrolase